MPVVFFEPEALLFVMEKQKPVIIGKKSSGLPVIDTGLPSNPSLYDKLEQDGIEIYVPKNLELPENSQITVRLVAGLTGRKLKAEITVQHAGPGFMGSRF
jgi:hypothetical protein